MKECVFRVMWHKKLLFVVGGVSFQGVQSAVFGKKISRVEKWYPKISLLEILRIIHNRDDGSIVRRNVFSFFYVLTTTMETMMNRMIINFNVEMID